MKKHEIGIAPSDSKNHIDLRIVYGMQCTWWDDIGKAGRFPEGMPCCPHCSSVLFEFENEKAWFQAAEFHEVENSAPGYSEMLRWARGKCFRTINKLRFAYANRPGRRFA